MSDPERSIEVILHCEFEGCQRQVTCVGEDGRIDGYTSLAENGSLCLDGWLTVPEPGWRSVRYEFRCPDHATEPPPSDGEG